MSNNFWNQPQQNNQSSQNSQQPSQNGAQSNNLLRRYQAQQQPPAQPGQQPFPPQAGAPQPQRGLLSGGSAGTQQSWARQMINRWSGKSVAMRGNQPPPAPVSPWAMPRPLTPPRSPEPLPKSEPWKRSHAVRVSMRMRHRRERWHKGHGGSRKIVIGVVISLVVILLAVVSSGGASAYAYYQDQLPRMQQLASQHISQMSRIYDRNMTLLYQAYDTESAYAGRRTPVQYKDIPTVMQQAMTAAEDPTFWDNTGVDPAGILRAAVEHNGGGSGLTQQLIKNLSHDDQGTYQRKISEAALSIGLTQSYPKAKIMEMYFNVAPFGSQELGIEAAVQDYFDIKPTRDPNFNVTPAIHYLDINAQGKPDPMLALARASFLAGMPQDPNNTDPTLESINQGNIQRALVRQQYVLGQMLKLQMNVNGVGPMTPAIVSQVEAISAKWTFHAYVTKIQSPHFVFWVISQVEAALGNGDPQSGKVAFLTGGYNIRTSMDLSLELYIERAINRHLNKVECGPFAYFTGCGPLSSVNNVNSAAVVVMDTKSGEVLAMDGSSNFNSKKKEISGSFNAALSPRQPGSSFKPIVYATAFEMGWYPGIVVKDERTHFPESNDLVASTLMNDPQKGETLYMPTDYHSGGQKPWHDASYPIRLSLQNSFNVPAVKAFNYAGSQNVRMMASRMGITAIDNFYASCKAKHPDDTGAQCGVGPPMALGTVEVPLLQMVGAYQVFADQGTREPAQGVLDIWDNYGHHLYHFDPANAKGTRVISKQISFMITNMLKDEPARAIEFTGAHTLAMYDWTLPNGTHPEVAAKTGTTDDFKDNWTIGYTPDVTVGVWAGNASGHQEFSGNVIGITGAAPIWHSVIERVMGRCDDTSIGCGSYKSPYKTYAFPGAPTGVQQVCVSSVNGLKGTGGSCDYMLDSMIPQQVGFTPDANPTGNGNNGKGKGRGNNGG